MFFWPHLIWKACLFPIGRSCINNNVNLSSDNYTFLNYIPKLHLHLHCHLNIRPDVNNCHSVGLFNVLISERAFILKAIYENKAATFVVNYSIDFINQESIGIWKLDVAWEKKEGFMMPSEGGQVVIFWCKIFVWNNIHFSCTSRPEMCL